MATQIDEGIQPVPAPSPGRFDTANASTAQLVNRLTGQVSQLVRNELKLARTELTEKGKQAGLGTGLLGAAAVTALYGGGALLTAGIAALALVLPIWAAALIVAAVLLVVAGLLGLAGKKKVHLATPPVPAEAVTGVKRDIETVKERIHR